LTSNNERELVRRKLVEAKATAPSHPRTYRAWGVFSFEIGELEEAIDRLAKPSGQVKILVDPNLD